MSMCVRVCVCVCYVYACMCVSVEAGKWGKKGGSVALQEETAIALCGFFSVPLTMRVGLWKRLSGNQVHYGCSSWRQL